MLAYGLISEIYIMCIPFDVSLCMIPKYRHKVFSDPCREVLKCIIQKIGYDYDIDIVELEIPEDHIHMVVGGEPKMLPKWCDVAYKEYIG